MSQKKVFIKDIKEKDHVASSFLVARKDPGISKSGKPYLALRLKDSTGELEARVWDDVEALGGRFRKNDIVAVKGYAVSYQGGLQMNVSSIDIVPEGQYSIMDMLPSSEKNHEDMVKRLDAIIEGIKDAHIKRLLKSIFEDPDIRARFMIAPAAKGMHHPYLGGLLEHVLSICGLAGLVAGHYGESINKDLLVAGAILHDMGKIYELSYEKAFDYTDEGRLLGHITIGIELVDRKIRQINGFPRELEVLIKHMLLSHHGHLEFGSPKRPKTMEAIILYYLDDLDAKVSSVKSLIEGDSTETWTPYQKLFERFIYRGPRAQDKREVSEGAIEEPTLSLFK